MAVWWRFAVVSSQIFGPVRHLQYAIYSKALTVHVPYVYSILTHSAHTTTRRLSSTKLAPFALTLTMGNDVDDLADAKNHEIGDKLAHLGKHQKGETEPETKHSTEVRYVLYRLYKYTACSGENMWIQNFDKSLNIIIFSCGPCRAVCRLFLCVQSCEVLPESVDCSSRPTSRFFKFH